MARWGDSWGVFPTGAVAAGVIAMVLQAGTALGADPVFRGTTELAALPSAERSAQICDEMERYLDRENEALFAGRSARWRRDLTSPAAYVASIASQRERLRHIIGAVESRVPHPELHYIDTTARAAKLAETALYTAYLVRWPVYPGVDAEGLLLEPKGEVRARIVALPDADQSPEQVAGLTAGPALTAPFARRLAENGCQVLVPTLVSRASTFSNSIVAKRSTNLPHREWIYRQAFELGRHIIGYEAQKVLAAVDWFEQQNLAKPCPIGVAGYGEGGLLALYGAAIDVRIDAVLVSGYFDSRQGIADEPIYRDIFGLLTEFGDAEIASLVAPRPLVIEHSTLVSISGAPVARAGRRAVAAPGRIETPNFERMRQEVDRMRAFFSGQSRITPDVTLVAGLDGAPLRAVSDAACSKFLQALGVTRPSSLPENVLTLSAPARVASALAERQRRQVAELVGFTQGLMRRSGGVREKFWADAVPQSAAAWPAATARYRGAMWDDLVGRYPPPEIAPAARTRLVQEKPHSFVYEVVFDVRDEVFGWGYLVVPKDLRAGEKRPVVVCQHGLEGLPAYVVNDDPAKPGFGHYKGFATQLAERGFITFAPHNFYRGENEFRQLQRLAHPMQKTLFAVTTLQHAQMLRWLSGLEFVDPKRIGFYGLSYGGNTAMRVPALLEQYAVVITSGDFNDWVFKNVTVDFSPSMVFHNVYEVFEFNLGHTFNHADMAALIAPRPFMVERGHNDGVARDEWVAAEYAKVRRLYTKLGIPERTTIEFFDGPHQINGVRAYDFLHEHLNWPARER